MLETRMAYHDPRHDTSTRASVVRPPGNPQQVVVTEVNAPEFYNQGNDMQPSRVDPRYGLLNTQPAILRPDPMWAHRWPDMGPNRGMTPQPFAWEQKQMDGLGAVTQAQRDRYQELYERAQRLSGVIAGLRRVATTSEEVDHIAMIDGQLDRAQTILVEADEMEDLEVSMAMDDAQLELVQVEERLAAYDARVEEGEGASTVALLLGGAAVLAVLYFATRGGPRSLVGAESSSARNRDRSWASVLRDGRWTVEWGGGRLSRAAAIAEARRRAASSRWHGNTVDPVLDADRAGRKDRKGGGLRAVPSIRAGDKCCPRGARMNKAGRCQDQQTKKFVSFVACARRLPAPRRVGVPEPFPKARW